MVPPESQATQPDAESFEDLNAALNTSQHLEHIVSDGSGDEQINQEALLAYYNTSGNGGVHP